MAMYLARPSLTIIIPTISRPSLARTLRSLRGSLHWHHPQALSPDDQVIVVGDGRQAVARELFEQFGFPHATYLETPERMNNYGHGPRNLAMAHAKGDYILSLDDDDEYVDGALAGIRQALLETYPRPHCFRIHLPENEAIWKDPEVRLCNVSTQMFCVPNYPDQLGTWGDRYEGDYDFLASTLAKWPEGSLVWREEVIVRYGRGK